MQASSSFEPFADRLCRLMIDMRLPLVVGHGAPRQPLSQAGPAAGATLRGSWRVLAGPWDAAR